MTDIKTQVRQAAETAFWNGGTYTPTMIQAAADAAALAALEAGKQIALEQGALFTYERIERAIAGFKPQPHPLLSRLTDLEQQQKELTEQIAAVRQEMEQGT